MRIGYWLLTCSMLLSSTSSWSCQRGPAAGQEGSEQPMTAPPPRPPPPPPPRMEFPTTSTEGEVTLAPGFTPSPLVVLGSTPGTSAATQLGAPCPTYIAEAPSYFLTISTPFQALTVMGQSDDTPVDVMIMGPHGGFLCSEPGRGVVQGAFPIGKYAVWIGTPSQGKSANFRLGFSEDPAADPAALPQSISGAWTAKKPEPVTLEPGFDPDPHVVMGDTTGEIEASQLDPSCAGFLSPQPDLFFRATKDFERLRILVRHTRDTALVMTDTHGKVFCADDEDRRFPVLDQPVPAGFYRIWVAPKVANVPTQFTLGFSTDEELRVRQLPRYRRPPKEEPETPNEPSSGTESAPESEPAPPSEPAPSWATKPEE